MKNTFIIALMVSAIGLLTISSKTTEKQNIIKQDSIVDNVKTITLSPIQQLYNDINLNGKLQFDAFEMAMKGFDNLSFRNKDVITIIDFTLPSTEKRMCVIDLKNKKLLFHTIVSHGRNSGEKYATQFSNRHGSFQSSLGFYRTEHTYQGGNGYSLVLEGLERNINDQARPRAVVMHGADYCSTQVIKSTGRLGRSYGCPALPRELNTPIINTIKNGSMLFIYADNKDYLANSKVFKSNNSMLAEHVDDAIKERGVGSTN